MVAVVAVVVAVVAVVVAVVAVVIAVVVAVVVAVAVAGLVVGITNQTLRPTHHYIRGHFYRLTPQDHRYPQQELELELEPGQELELEPEQELEPVEYLLCYEKTYAHSLSFAELAVVDE